MPQEVSSFVGRQRDLAELQGLVESARLVTLTGPGGSGKTRLALAAASRLVDNYDDGIWFVDLAAISAPDEVVSAAASTLGVRAEHGRALADALVEWLSERQLLLVLDNCEHVVDGAAKLCDSILRYCPTVRVFATSREGLMVGGEHIQQVAPLSLPPADCVDAATARRAEAVELFVDRAVTHDTRFSLDDHCAEVVAATCRRLDGIPLAIELAAARLRHLGIHDLAHLLDERFRLLNVGPRTAPRRQQTLTAMVQWSYDLLTAPERRVFERLSLFAGPWTVDAATRVCADAEIDHWEVLDHIGGLVDKSLVVVGRAGEQVRYRLLETLRAYAADRLRERSSAEQIRACDGFVEHFVGLARRVDANGHDQSAGAWFALLDDSRANLHAALARCSTTARYRARGCELAGAMADYWQVRGETELRDQLSALVDNADTASAGVRARALLALAEMLYVCRDVASAEARLAQALPLSTEAQDAALECKILDGLAHACWEQGDPDGARQRLDEAEVVARDAGDPHGVLLVRQNRAYIEAALGDPAASKRLLLENLSDARELGEPRLLMMSLLNLGWDDFGLGAHESARAYLAEAIAIAGSIGADPRRLQMYAILAMVAVVELDGEEAGRNLAVALDAPIATLAGNIDLLHDCLRACLLTLHLLGDDRAAMRLCGALDRFVSQNKLIIEPLEQTLDARVRTSLEQRLGADVVELEKAAGRSNTVPESLALARAALQNRQRVEPGVSSAVPTAVAVRGLTS
ncbi:MAG: hypothetical protein JWL83_1412 [Actinomycetia bacterium]|nr:hypothetical protein [Actinomycetes bacterium]